MLRVHVPRRHGLQPRVDQPDEVPATTTARSTSRATATRSASSSSRRRSWSTLELPDRADRAEQPRLPPARPRLREPRHAADAAWASRTTRDEGRAIARRAHRDHDRPGLRASAPRWRRAKGPFAGFAQEPRADAQRHEHAPRRGLRDRPRSRARATSVAPRARTGTTPSRSASSTATATRRPPCSRRPAPSACYGLRHDRHRARLRAREVQEARRRRLLQDRQPVGARRAEQPRLQRRADPGDRRATSSAPTRFARRAARQPRSRSKQRGLTDAEIDARSRRRCPACSSSAQAFAPWVLGDETLRAPRHPEGRARRSPASTLLAHARLHRRRDRRGQRLRSAAA